MRVLRIADASIALVPASRDMKIGLADEHLAFSTEAEMPDVVLFAEWSDLGAAPDGEPVFDGGAWTLARLTDGYVFRFFTPLRGPSPYKQLRLSTDLAEGRVALHRAFYPQRGPVNPLDYPLDELLLVHYLSRREGVIVHGCGIVDEDGKGYLFVGHSGAGKTTTALLWEGMQGVRILSDDRIVLRRQGGKVLMHGTPWHGTGRLSSPGSSEIAGLFLIEHGDKNAFEPIQGGALVADLVARSFLPFHDGAAISSVMCLLEQVASEAPCLRFSFTPDESAIRAVREWAKGSYDA